MMRPVDCQTFQYWCEDISDARMEPGFREELTAHQAECAGCADYALRSQHQRRALRGLTVRPVPVNLAVNLRVMASKEVARRSSRVNLATRMDVWRGKIGLFLDNLWRPLAIPTAAGLPLRTRLASAPTAGLSLPSVGAALNRIT